MPDTTEEFTIGVEEEYQIVDAKTRALIPHGQTVLHQAQKTLGEDVQPELQQTQIEIATPVCKTLDDVRQQLTRMRKGVIDAARQSGNEIASAGTHPFSRGMGSQVTPKERYQDLMRDYQQIARELVIFGCHVHVGLNDQEMALHVLNRARIWLAPLLALSASSPFWRGEDTGYASYRTEMWSRWPMSGPPLYFASRQEYDDLIHALVATKTLEDVTKVYWDMRIPERVPTIETRVADVCPTLDEAVMIAGLTRALVRTCYTQAQQDTPFPAVRPELLKSAHWRAARYGLDGELIDVSAQQSVPARDLLQTFLNFVRPDLENAGEWEEIHALVEQTLRQGNSAMRQRAAFQRSGNWQDVVDLVVAETASGC